MNAFISAGDSLSGVYIGNYLNTAFPGKNEKVEHVYIDSISNAIYDIAAISKLDDHCWIIGNHKMKVVYIKEDLDPCHREFFETYPADIVIFSNFYSRQQIGLQSFSPQAAVVLDGSNNSGGWNGAGESFQSLYFTEKMGAYIKSY